MTEDQRQLGQVPPAEARKQETSDLLVIAGQIRHFEHSLRPTYARTQFIDNLMLDFL